MLTICDKCGREITDTVYTVIAIEQDLLPKLKKLDYTVLIEDGHRDCVEELKWLFNNAPAEKKKGVKPKYDHGKIVALWNAGKSVQFIADDMKCNDTTVRDVLRANGIDYIKKAAQ